MTIGSSGRAAASNAPSVLTVNSGSSSIKFAVFDVSTSQRTVSGQLERIGLAESRFRATTADMRLVVDQPVVAANHDAAVSVLLDWLLQNVAFDRVLAVGHRIVHGGSRFRETTLLDTEVIEQLRALIPLAPNHLPGEVLAIEAFRNRLSAQPQFGCFDTAFHRDLSRVARPLVAASSWRIWERAAAWRRCRTDAASIPRWDSRRRRGW